MCVPRYRVQRKQRYLQEIQLTREQQKTREKSNKGFDFLLIFEEKKVPESSTVHDFSVHDFRMLMPGLVATTAITPAWTYGFKMCIENRLCRTWWIAWTIRVLKVYIEKL